MNNLKEINPEMKEQEILIVGGSLSGLTCALVCARFGVHTRVLERAEANTRSGGGLGVDRALLADVIGIDPRKDGALPHLPVITSSREATSWLALYKWLRGYAVINPLIEIEDGVQITEVTQNENEAIALTADGKEISAPAILGADGYRSIVRRAVNPAEPFASYAGYMLWRGIVSERKMKPSTRWPRNSDGVGMINASGYRLIAYVVPGEDGSLIPGERQIIFAWFDITHNDLLHETHCLSPDGHVLSTLSNENIPSYIKDQLPEVARSIWPEPWLSAVDQSIKDNIIFGTPICEYVPALINRGRLAILGDAAHVASPMTGRGFATGVGDAADLAWQLGNIQKNKDRSITDALEQYGKSRLKEARALGNASKNVSREYISIAKKQFNQYN